ncbi:type II secretory pathway, component ExeA (predicted ATPase) [Desulfocurvibacter africanus PCS]|uniref:Type II secretory pathway, component ExeA (Predicted ATPase) n=1 Tax=Desulfocurvibacter africanus PCS TaxID=1262666 RepID=M5PUL2_DESAF|nr:AAA family ATPase [Desulfocurvibacter africanus]EMG37769.1 type II secretory pathway, component ExeA (predicted ATPase) [Desulfocurvibacter africanus PCS]
MYRDFFGFTVLPFENAPDPKFFFDQGQYRATYALLLDSVAAGRGLMVVLGPIGTGKTTLSQKLLDKVPAKTSVIWLAMPPQSPVELLQLIAHELGLSVASDSPSFLLRDIRQRLLDLRARGEHSLLIIDESHLMSTQIFESVRILNNLEAGPDKLLQILLLGQKELKDQLDNPQMAPLKQRISLLSVLGRMNKDMVRQYVDHRIQIAGGKPGIFSPEALGLIGHCADGSPRLINSLSHGALQAAFHRGSHTVGVEDAKLSAEGFGLGKPALAYMRSRVTLAAPTDQGMTSQKQGKASPQFGARMRLQGVQARQPMQAQLRLQRTGFFIFVASLVTLATSIVFYLQAVPR